MNTLNKLFEKHQYHLMAFVFLAIIGIHHASAECFVTRNMNGVPIKYEGNCVQDIPPGILNGRPTYNNGQGQQTYVTQQGNIQQGNIQQGAPMTVNAGNINANGLSTNQLIVLGAALLGGSTAKGNQRVSTALEYGAIAAVGTAIYDKVNEPKPQPQLVSSSQQSSSSSNWCARGGNKYACDVPGEGPFLPSGGDPRGIRCFSNQNPPGNGWFQCQ